MVTIFVPAGLRADR